MPRPLEGRYVPTLLTALLALTPYVLVTTGGSLFAEQIQRDLAMPKVGSELIASLSTAGYAFGALLAGDLINRFTQRRLFLLCEAVAGIFWLVAACASSPAQYAAGEIGGGLMTGMLLVIALPPVVRRFGARILPLTAIFINLALFGGVAGGPLLGGAVAALNAWRWLFGALAVSAALSLAVACLTLPAEDPPRPDLPFDLAAILLAFGATVLPFSAAGALSILGFRSPFFLAPLGIGLACFVALLVVEYRKEEPLAPIRKMASTLPLAGTIAATIGGAVFVTLLRLSSDQMREAGHASAPAVSLAFWPQLVGAFIAAGLLGLLLRTRWLSLLVFGAMVLLVAAGALLLSSAPSPHNEATLAATFLLGLGAGGSVSPGLFLAGLALPSSALGRIVALIELVRGLGDYMLAPIMVELAHAASGQARTVNGAGFDLATAWTIAIGAAATLLLVLLHVGGRGGFARPDLRQWLDGEKPALASPPLLAAWRGGAGPG